MSLVLDAEGSWREGPRVRMKFQDRCGFGSHSPGLGGGGPGALGLTACTPDLAFVLVLMLSICVRNSSGCMQLLW